MNTAIGLPRIDNPVTGDAPVVRRPIPDSAFYRPVRAGHLRRTGHVLAGELVSDDGGEVWRIVRSCCQAQA
jgi:hypothetical protein